MLTFLSYSLNCFANNTHNDRDFQIDIWIFPYKSEISKKDE